MEYAIMCLETAEMCSTNELQEAQKNGQVEVILVPTKPSLKWMEELQPKEIIATYEEEIERIIEIGGIEIKLLQVDLSKKMEIAIMQLQQATTKSHLEMIIQTLLNDTDIPTGAVEKLRGEKYDIKVPEEATTLIRAIQRTELIKHLMAVENQTLMLEMEKLKKRQQQQPKGFMDKLKSPMQRFQKVLGSASPKPKRFMDDTLIDYGVVNTKLDIKPHESTRMFENNASLISENQSEVEDTRNDNDYVTGIEESFCNIQTKLQAIKTPRFDANDVEGSLTQLEILANQLAPNQHGQLIITFLAAANKLELLGNTTQLQKTNVKEFTSMVRNELGLSSKKQLSKKLNNMQQIVGESFLELKSRIINCYRRLHDRVTLSKSDKAIIAEIFIEAINSEHVKRQLRLEDNDLEMILRRANLIKQVEAQNQTQSTEQNHLIDSIYSLLMKNENKCTTCGLSHPTSDCLASAKLQSKYKKATGTGRDMKFNDFSNKPSYAERAGNEGNNNSPRNFSNQVVNNHPMKQERQAVNNNWQRQSNYRGNNYRRGNNTNSYRGNRGYNGQANKQEYGYQKPYLPQYMSANGNNYPANKNSWRNNFNDQNNNRGTNNNWNNYGNGTTNKATEQGGPRRALVDNQSGAGGNRWGDRQQSQHQNYGIIQEQHESADEEEQQRDLIAFQNSE